MVQEGAGGAFGAYKLYLIKFSKLIFFKWYNKNVGFCFQLIASKNGTLTAIRRMFEIKDKTLKWKFGFNICNSRTVMIVYIEFFVSIW